MSETSPPAAETVALPRLPDVMTKLAPAPGVMLTAAPQKAEGVTTSVRPAHSRVPGADPGGLGASQPRNCF